MNKAFTHKDHEVEIVNDRPRYALTYIVSIDGEYVGDCYCPINVAVDAAKAIINRMEAV